MPTSAKKPSVVFLMGPTAVGKTELALELAQHLDTEIISVDSTLVYRGFDIGTAKPSMEERQRVRHHLIDIRDPLDTYSAADFRRDALVQIDRLCARNKIPLLVGGSMLYFKVLREGLAELPAADQTVRAELALQAQAQGWPSLHRKLQQVDPETARRLHPNHSQRIARALEVYRLTGATLTELHRQQRQQADEFLSNHNVIQLALTVHDRNILHKRIAARFERMLQLGFEDEVRKLFERRDLAADLPALRAVGYRQMWSYLSGACDRPTMREKGIAATRQLAKRQLTWLRSWRDLQNLYMDSALDNTGLSAKPKFTEIRDQALNYIDSTTI